MTLDAIKSVIIIYPNMTMRQIAALLVMVERTTIKSCELAACLKVHRSAVTRMWDTLSIYGLIKRKRSMRDMRDVIGALTPKGIKFCEQLLTEGT